MKRVVIVGGGTGGTMLANFLDKRKFQVTVVSESTHHVFQPALLYVAFKQAKPKIVRDERRLLSRLVDLIHQRVSHIDLGSRIVTTADGIKHEYDNLVVATGIKTDSTQIPGLVPVNQEYGDYHSSVIWAEKLWGHLDAFGGGTIALGQSTAICKCPPSPIEGIMLTDALLRKRGLRDKAELVFFTPYPRAYPAEAIDDVVEPLLKERGIKCMTFFDVDKVDAEKRQIVSIEGDSITYDLPIIIPPFIGAPIVYEPAGVLDPSRFVKVDKTSLRIEGFDNAFAIGDASDAPTAKSGVSAHLEARVVAKNLGGGHAVFDGRTNCPMDLADGSATFVIGSYTAPLEKYRPSRITLLMKIAMAKIYW